MLKIFAQIKSKRWYKILTNKFVLATLVFAIWMVFLDVNSLMIHSELNRDIDELEQSIEYYQSEIISDKKKLEELTSNPEKLEKFAREEYWMKRPGEEIYIIEE